MDLKNKVVVVTGGSSGLGYHTTDNFLSKGVKAAIILDINETLGSEAVKNLQAKHGNRVAFMKCNVVTDLEEVTKKILDQYKYVDVLVNNAGVLAENSVEKSIGINTTAVMNWSIKYNELMRKDKGGKGGTIINISSIYGFRVTQYIPVYHASKFAVLGFSTSLGHEYNFKRTGVRVLTICPGLTKTNIVVEPKPFDKSDEVAKDMEKSLLNDYDWQLPEQFGKGAVEVCEKAKSGTAWLLEGGRPMEEVEVKVLQ